jgi:hypothetical protein
LKRSHLVIGVGIGALISSSIAAAPTLAASHTEAAITVTGTVTASGHAMAGESVEIHAWPDQAIVQALKPGQKVPWVLVGTATTRANGTYSTNIPLAKLMPEASYGVVNLEADSAAGMYSFPVVVSENGGNSYLAGSHPVINLTSDSPADHGCKGGWYYLYSLGKHWATVGQTYILTGSAKQKFVYKKSQSTSLGFGISQTGGAGTYSEDDTYSWSVGSVTPWPWYGPHRSIWYRTKFKWGQYQCRVLDGGPFEPNYGEHVNGYAGGAQITKAKYTPYTPSRFCDYYVTGTEPEFDTSTAVEWTKKISIDAVYGDAALGFDASEQTGYDTDGAVTYDMVTGHNICGWKDDPGGDPKVVEVR